MYLGRMRALTYTRVSTAEQANSGLGLDAQRSRLADELDRRGWTDAGSFEDAGASAKSLVGRPGLAAALELLRTGEADVLVVAKLDRLSRSLLDFAGLMETSRKQGWALVALDLGVDTSTASGEMIANVMATFAQFERRLIGQRTSEALQAKKAQGVKLGRPRLIDSVTRERVATLRAGGRSLRSIADVLNGENVAPAGGGKRWYASTVKSLLDQELAA